MGLISNVTYSRLNNQNIQGVKENKSNETFLEKSNIKAKEAVEGKHEKAGIKNKQKLDSNKMAKKQCVSYETAMPKTVSEGLTFIRDLEKQISGTKFFLGTVSYGNYLGNASDTNFVINPYFLERLGTDETAREQFEEDVKYLSEFSKMFREQQLSQGREIVNQGWFCDENGNWGGWCISKPVNEASVLQDMTDYAEEIRQKKTEEQKEIEQKLKEYFGERFLGFHVKWLEEDWKNEEILEAEEKKNDSEQESESMSVSVGVNVGKTARKIAAAKTTSNRDEKRKTTEKRVLDE